MTVVTFLNTHNYVSHLLVETGNTTVEALPGVVTWLLYNQTKNLCHNYSNFVVDAFSDHTLVSALPIPDYLTKEVIAIYTIGQDVVY